MECEKNETSSSQEINPVTKKIMVIIGLVIFLLVPLYLVENQISDRKGYEEVARKEVAKGWGGSVEFGAPKLVIRDKYYYSSLSETIIEINSKEKKRGVFYVPVYVTKLKSKLTFNKPIIADEKSIKPSQSPDHIIFKVKPITSIQNYKITDTATGGELKAKLADDGIKVSLDELKNIDIFSNNIEVEITVRGTGMVTYESTSDLEKVKMVGNWKKPMFIGAVLPTDNMLSSNGFEAFWTLNSLTTETDGARLVTPIGADFLWINTDYSMTEKAIKYGILFIALTFLLVFVAEFVGGIKIHLVQYGFIGLSISVFYLLLLAISETIGFGFAYLISSLATSGLIVIYVNGFLNNKRFVRMILLEQFILNLFFYILLTLEESAFLVGSVGLFFALAVIMLSTRKLNWYFDMKDGRIDVQNTSGESSNIDDVAKS